LPKPPGKTFERQLNPLELKIFGPPGKVCPPWNSPFYGPVLASSLFPFWPYRPVHMYGPVPTVQTCR